MSYAAPCLYAATGEITVAQAEDELIETIVAMVARSTRGGTRRAAKARR